MRPQLVPLQKFLRAQEVFRDDRRQVAVVGGLHGLHICSWVPVPARPYTQDGVPLYEFAPPLTGLSWEPCGQLDLGSSTKCHPYWGPQSKPTTEVPESAPLGWITESVNTTVSAGSDLAITSEVQKVKTQFEDTLDAFTAFSGVACFPVVHDSGASITLHPRSFRDMLLRKGCRPVVVGHKRVCTEGFTGSPVITIVPIYGFPLRL